MSNETAVHELYMRRCLQLAKTSIGYVAPNPMVGSVIVCDGKIIGEGYHREYGGAHAEVNAIQAVTDEALLTKSTLYVNLEPCSHFGKTPPCSDLILAKKIPHVVVGTLDPNPVVAGRGIERLKAAGVKVESGILAEECNSLNRRFFTFHSKKRPYFILKWAQTADGFMDKERGEEKGINWITGEDAQRLVHQWRAQEQAILVGKKTVVNDDPSLSVRLVAGKQPVRLFIGNHWDELSDAKIFRDGLPGLIYNTNRNDKQGEIQFVKLDSTQSMLNQISNDLFNRNIQSVLIEGGAFTLGSFIEKELWDEARILKGRVSFAAGLKAPHIDGKLISTLELESCQIEMFERLQA